MTAQEIRRQYLEFFKEKQHVVISRTRLVPENDPTTLFTGSGMQPLLPYLLGREHPAGQRLVNSQPCLRAQDIDEVGDNRHTTFFEMLGNWSLGDYFKKSQIPWFFEFLVDIIGLDPNKLYVTCFIGDKDNDIPKDNESAELWEHAFIVAGVSNVKQVEIGSEENGYKVGMQGGRIFYYDASKNWWSRSGTPAEMPAGEPGGPDSEAFYEFDFIEHDTKYGEHCHPNCDCGRFMEIGNSVFMEYIKTENGFEKLPKRNVDFGGGLERIAAASLNNPDVFEISLLKPIIEKLEEISGKKYASHTESMRVIADHLRAATFLAVDGVVPSNKTQGYVMRRLVRRAIRFAFELGVEQNFLEQIVPVIADLYHNDFPEVAENRDNAISVLVKEEKAFRQTLRKGLHEFDRLTQGFRITTGFGNTLESADNMVKKKLEAEANRHPETGLVSGGLLFRLYDTHGFPVELSKEEAFKRGIKVADDADEVFEKLMAEQRARSQTAAKGTFKGGLGGQTLQHKKYHTATHLLQAALRQIFGNELRQHGSNITEERLRFDFNLDHKMTDEEKQKVEELVNGWISEDLPVTFREYPTEEALKMGALGAFGERYGEVVKVYQIGDGDHVVSREICGGPHVDHTGQLASPSETSSESLADKGGKKFKIVKEESSAAGIRRIKAVLE